MRKQIPVQTLGAKLAVEALGERVLPGAAWCDVDGGAAADDGNGRVVGRQAMLAVERVIGRGEHVGAV